MEGSSLEHAMHLIHGKIGVRQDTVKGMAILRKEAARGDPVAQAAVAAFSEDGGEELSLEQQSSIRDMPQKALPKLRARANKGDPWAQVFVALWILGEKNPNAFFKKHPMVYFEAVDLIEKAAKQGNATAQHTLAEYFRSTEKNGEQFLLWCVRAAVQGHRMARHSLAMEFKIGEIIPKDEEMAAFWFAKGCDQHDQLCIEDGLNGLPCTLVVCAFEQCLREKKAEADSNVRREEEKVLQFHLREAYWQRDDEVARDALAMFGIELYCNSEGLKDTSIALEAIKLASSEGSSLAQVFHRCLSIDGTGHVQGLEKVLARATKNDAAAAFVAGWYAERWLKSRACVEWYRIGAELGHGLSMQRYGRGLVNYAKGKFFEGVRWLMLAAEQNVCYAHYDLGRMLVQGLIPKDDEKAAMHLLKASFWVKDNSDEPMAKQIAIYLRSLPKEVVAKMRFKKRPGIARTDHALMLWFGSGRRGDLLQSKLLLIQGHLLDDDFVCAAALGFLALREPESLPGYSARALFEEARWMLEKQAENGDAKTLCWLAVCLDPASMGSILRSPKAIDLMSRAANRGYWLAQYWWAQNLILSGDQSAGVEFLEKAARQGHYIAANVLIDPGGENVSETGFEFVAKVADAGSTVARYAITKCGATNRVAANDLYMKKRMEVSKKASAAKELLRLWRTLQSQLLEAIPSGARLLIVGMVAFQQGLIMLAHGSKEEKEEAFVLICADFGSDKESKIAVKQQVVGEDADAQTWIHEVIGSRAVLGLLQGWTGGEGSFIDDCAQMFGKDKEEARRILAMMRRIAKANKMEKV